MCLLLAHLLTPFNQSNHLSKTPQWLFPGQSQAGEVAKGQYQYYQYYGKLLGGPIHRIGSTFSRLPFDLTNRPTNLQTIPPVPSEATELRFVLTPASIWGEDEERDFLDWDTEVGTYHVGLVVVVVWLAS